MKKLIIALFALTMSAAQATPIPFVPDCKMDYSVKSIGIILGVGAGQGVLECHGTNSSGVNETTVSEINIAILNLGEIGYMAEEGTLYSLGLGFNTETPGKFLGALAAVQAGFALPEVGGVAARAGLIATTDPSVQAFLSVSRTSGFGVMFGYGAWVFSDAKQDAANEAADCEMEGGEWTAQSQTEGYCLGNDNQD